MNGIQKVSGSGSSGISILFIPSIPVPKKNPDGSRISDPKTALIMCHSSTPDPLRTRQAYAHPNSTPPPISHKRVNPLHPTLQKQRDGIHTLGMDAVLPDGGAPVCGGTPLLMTA